MIKLKPLFILTILSFLLTTNSAYAIDPLKPYHTETAPKIDGILDDIVWQKSPSETGFKIYYPDYGGEMTEHTKVWYAL